MEPRLPPIVGAAFAVVPDDQTPSLFEQLRGILEPFGSRVHVEDDEPGLYYQRPRPSRPSDR